MKKIIVAMALLTSAAVATSPIEAAGCLKGAAVGGVAGHFVGRGHAVLGAAVGCAYGHHRAAQAAKAAKAQQALAARHH